MRRNTPDKFWAKVSVKTDTDCWEWLASKFNTGYGQHKLVGKNLRAHRVAWELTHGEIPEGLAVLHTCDNRGCCNPKHLFLGTQLDNMADMIAKGRKVVNSGADNHMYGRTSTMLGRKGSDHPCYGLVRTQSNKDKVRAAQTGASNSFYGRKHSEDSKQKIRNSLAIRRSKV